MSVFRPLPPMVHLICRRCDRSGRYRLERYAHITEGRDPHTALTIFARKAGCKLAANPDPEWDKRCGLVYDLEKQGL